MRRETPSRQPSCALSLSIHPISHHGAHAHARIHAHAHAHCVLARRARAHKCAR